MRDVGLFIWVLFLIVGVIGSISSSARKQRGRAAPAREQPAVPPQWSPPQAAIQRIVAAAQAAQQVKRVTTPAPPPPRPQPAPSAAARPRPPVHEEAPRPRRAPLFAGRQGLARAVVAAEVLGKPLGLRDH